MFTFHISLTVINVHAFFKIVLYNTWISFFGFTNNLTNVDRPCTLIQPNSILCSCPQLNKGNLSKEQLLVVFTTKLALMENWENKDFAKEGHIKIIYGKGLHVEEPAVLATQVRVSLNLLTR